MFRKALLIGGLVLAGINSVKAEDALIGASAGMEMYYYQKSYTKTQANGEEFYNVLGYVEVAKTKEKVPFRALFNCGSSSAIAVEMAGVKRIYPISDRIRYGQTNAGNFYSLQSAHCPDNHFLKSSK